MAIHVEWLPLWDELEDRPSYAPSTQVFNGELQTWAGEKVSKKTVTFWEVCELIFKEQVLVEPTEDRGHRVSVNADLKPLPLPETLQEVRRRDLLALDLFAPKICEDESFLELDYGEELRYIEVPANGHLRFQARLFQHALSQDRNSTLNEVTVNGLDRVHFLLRMIGSGTDCGGSPPLLVGSFTTIDRVVEWAKANIVPSPWRLGWSLRDRIFHGRYDYAEVIPVKAL